jgi:Na+-driven multidrug efflux pump
MLTHFILRKGALRFGKIHFSLPLTGKIIKRGLPEMLSQFGTPVTTICMNYVLIRSLGDLSVSAFSVMSYLLSFSMGIFFGVSEGLQPLIGQSYGRKDTKDLKYYFHSGLVINVSASFAVYALLILFGKPVVSLFNTDPDLIKAAAGALPKFGWGFLLIALNLMTSSYLYSTKRTRYAVIIAICRCIVINSLSILLLPRIAGPGIIWYAVGIAELISFFAAMILLKYSERNGVIFR